MRVLLLFFFLFTWMPCVFPVSHVIPDDLISDIHINKKIYVNNPDSQEAAFNLAMSYAYTGHIRQGWAILKELDKTYAHEVVEHYEPILQIDQSNWKTPFKLAFGYYFIDRKDDAMEMFSLSRERNKNNVWILGFLALVKGDMGQVDDAIYLCHEALKLEPNAAAIHMLLGEGYRKKGQYFKFLKHIMIAGRLETASVLSD
jgi:tetratricopeptide (TPR) repeat protein